MMAYMESFSGPIPPPAILERYAATYGDAPRIIFETFEKQTLHRHEMEQILIRGSEKRAGRGQFLGTSILLVALLGGMGLAFTGREAIGIAVVGLALTTGILSYVFGDFIPGRKK